MTCILGTALTWTLNPTFDPPSVYEVAGDEDLYPGHSAAEIIYRVVFEGRRPCFPDAGNVVDEPMAAYQALAVRCWAHEAAERPTMAQVVEELEKQLENVIAA